MFGYWATGRPAMATRPTMTMTMAITIATIGRLMKKRYMLLLPRSGAFGTGGGRSGRGGGGKIFRRDPHSLLHLLGPLHDDPLPHLQPGLDHDEPPAFAPRLHGPDAGDIL